MTNNDILRRIRYIFDYDDSRMIAIFALAELDVRRGHIVSWLLKDDDPAYQACNDRMLATFLNGLITQNRGKRDGPTPEPEKTLTNNLILMKLKIALDLQSEDVIDILKLAGFQLGTPELSSFLRKPGHRNYRECKDQVLRNFLSGLQVKFRDQSPGKAKSPWPDRTLQ
ncbi:MAG: DUF1456 family protein [Halioglobus sp.]